MRVTNELLNIDVWLRCNKLQKANYVIFRPSQRKVNHSFYLSFGGQPLTQSNVTKFLGVYLDEHLASKYHITLSVNKSLNQLVFYPGCVSTYPVRPKSCCTIPFIHTLLIVTLRGRPLTYVI